MDFTQEWWRNRHRISDHVTLHGSGHHIARRVVYIEYAAPDTHTSLKLTPEEMDKLVQHWAKIRPQMLGEEPTPKTKGA